MSTANTLDTLNGLFKEVYAEKLKDLIPDGVKMVNRVPFSGRATQLGNFYHQPVILGLEHGVTFAGSGSDAFALNAPVAGQILDAQVRGSQMVLRSVLGYKSASASSSGKEAFISATKYLVQNMLKSMTKKLEIELFYGQIGYGTAASASSNDIVITTGEWAPGIWAGSENMPIEVRNAAGSVIRGESTVSAVDFANKTITTASNIPGVVSTDVIWHKGAYGNEFAGIHKIMTNTGELFGINATTYSLWKSGEYSAGSAALSLNKIQEAIALGMEKGLEGDVVLFINPDVWADLMTEQSALRQYDSSYSSSTAENGSREIKFASQAGNVEVVSSIYVKKAYGYLISIDELMRVGSTDITFKRPGTGDQFFRELENNAGYELRAYCDEALFINAPGHCVLIYAIV
jgi:hypothetical protein